MRRTLPLPALLALAFALSACGAHSPATPDPSNANYVTNANTISANMSMQGTGPHNAGIGGTSESNRNAAVSGNTNIAPVGVNKNVGRSGANGNRP